MVKPKFTDWTVIKYGSTKKRLILKQLEIKSGVVIRREKVSKRGAILTVSSSFRFYSQYYKRPAHF